MQSGWVEVGTYMWKHLSPLARDTTRDFSSKSYKALVLMIATSPNIQFVIFPPTGAPALLNCISIYFPKRELLSLRSVFALPKAEKILVLINL
jgi:hypothetical protein